MPFLLFPLYTGLRGPFPSIPHRLPSPVGLCPAPGRYRAKRSRKAWLVPGGQDIEERHRTSLLCVGYRPLAVCKCLLLSGCLFSVLSGAGPGDRGQGQAPSGQPTGSSYLSGDLYPGPAVTRGGHRGPQLVLSQPGAYPRAKCVSARWQALLSHCAVRSIEAQVGV